MATRKITEHIPQNWRPTSAYPIIIVREIESPWGGTLPTDPLRQPLQMANLNHPNYRRDVRPPLEPYNWYTRHSVHCYAAYKGAPVIYRVKYKDLPDARALR